MQISGAKPNLPERKKEPQTLVHQRLRFFASIYSPGNYLTLRPDHAKLLRFIPLIMTVRISCFLENCELFQTIFLLQQRYKIINELSFKNTLWFI